MNPLFNLKVASREGVIFNGQAASITSYNEKGTFDVLASHTNFISLVKKGITIREKEDSEEKEILFNNALMRVRDSNVEVYIGVEGIANS